MTTKEKRLKSRIHNLSIEAERSIHEGENRVKCMWEHDKVLIKLTTKILYFCHKMLYFKEKHALCYLYKM